MQRKTFFASILALLCAPFSLFAAKKKTGAITFGVIHDRFDSDHPKDRFGIGWERVVGEFGSLESDSDFIRCAVVLPIQPTPEDVIEAMEILIEQLNSPSRDKCAFGDQELTGREHYVKSLRK